MTVLDAVLKELESANQPMTADEIFDAIVARGSYSFKAKDPRSIVRSAIRRHIRGTTTPRLSEIRKGHFALIR